MEFWEELSPNVKRYVLGAVIVALALLLMRSCVGADQELPRPSRGVETVP